jgi:hypothetical protein
MGWIRYLAVVVACLPVACGPCRNSHTRILADSDDWQEIGVPLTDPTLPFGTGLHLSLVAADPARYSGVDVLARDAEVIAVCERDGCWLLARGDDGGEITVTLAHPGSRIPADAVGARVVICGRVERLDRADDAQTLPCRPEASPASRRESPPDRADAWSIAASGVRIDR